MHSFFETGASGDCIVASVSQFVDEFQNMPGGLVKNTGIWIGIQFIGFTASFPSGDSRIFFSPWDGSLSLSLSLIVAGNPHIGPGRPLHPHLPLYAPSQTFCHPPSLFSSSVVFSWKQSTGLRAHLTGCGCVIGESHGLLSCVHRLSFPCPGTSQAGNFGIH